MNVCRQENVVVACSALKKKYRDVLANTDKGEEHVKEIAFVRSRPLALSVSLATAAGIVMCVCTSTVWGMIIYCSIAWVMTILSSHSTRSWPFQDQVNLPY